MKINTAAVRYATITLAQYNQIMAEFRQLNARIDTMQYRIDLILTNQRR